MSLRMLDTAGVGPDASVVDIGGGASRLAATLLERGHGDVTVLDLSTVALDSSRRGDRAELTRWVRGDVRGWRPERSFDVWHDRAVLHFLTTETDQARYRETLRAATAPGSIAVIATFAPDGPQQCSGLPVSRYTGEQIGGLLGPDWILVAETRDEHITPAGVMQPFTWVALRRN